MRVVARLVFLIGVRRRVAMENLAIAFPQMSLSERRDLARRNYLHLGECAADFLRSPSLTDEELFAMVEPGDWGKISLMTEAKQGFVGCTAHLGNFELFGVFSARRGARLSILTRPLKGSANALWVRTRARAGIREIHKGMENLVESVKQGDALALLVDQNMLPRRAVFAPFFGKLAATTPAPALVAERTGAPVVLAFLERIGEGRYRVVVEGPLAFERHSDNRDQDILEFTTLINQRLEQQVRQRPEQWFWLHRRWKTRPPDEIGDPGT
jgi:KDO2-lipid IV(A) lauroyltransferase